jgi:glucose dehydrogenase
VANKERWRIDFNPSGGALSTAGQLIFVGENGGRFMALDPATGQTLWETKLLTGIATPVTYELDGVQYIAVMSGVANGRVFAFKLP